MNQAVAISVLTTTAALLIMAGEAVLSAFNEKLLRSRGAIEPADDVINTMRWAYPGTFVAIGIEGALRGPSAPDLLMLGLAVFGVAKALKIWAISSLGSRWSYRVLVVPGEPLVTSGPYRFMSHPNYLAVFGEMIGVGMIVFAPLTGAAGAVLFGRLMVARIRVEDKALGRLK